MYVWDHKGYMLVSKLVNTIDLGSTKRGNTFIVLSSLTQTEQMTTRNEGFVSDRVSSTSYL